MLVNKHPVVFYSLVVVTFIIAMIITIIPLSAEYQVLRPELICLLTIYWVISVPQHLGVRFAFCVGLIQDIVVQSTWGAHALGLSVVAYICVSSYQRIKSYSIWHQTVWVSVLLGLNKVVVNWVLSLSDYQAPVSSLVASIIISTLLWPVLIAGLRRFRHHYRLV